MSKSKRPNQSYPLVEVWWDDAAALTHGWKTKEEFERESIKPEIMISVGFLLKETEDHVIIAMDLDKDGASNQRSQIPKGMMRKLKILRPADSTKLLVPAPVVLLSKTSTDH
jgi:hypothetical protein